MNDRPPRHKRTSNSPESQCIGKFGFASYAEASEVNERRGKKARANRAVYKCSACSKFHLGSRKKVQPGTPGYVMCKSGGKHHMRHHYEGDGA